MTGNFSNRWTTVGGRRTRRSRFCAWTVAFLAFAFLQAQAQTDSGPDLEVITEEQTVAAPNPLSNSIPGAPIGTHAISSILGGSRPTLAPTETARSFVLGSASVSESADTNPGRLLNGIAGNSSSIESVTRLFGNVQLLTFRPHFETAIDYVGGGAFSNNFGSKGVAEQFHRIDFGEHIRWSRGDLTLGDSFGDLPGSDIGSSLFGPFVASQFGFPSDNGLSDFLGSSDFGEVAQQAHITNVVLAQFTENLSRRSSLTLEGAYSLTAYFAANQNLVNSRQVSTRAGYNYEVSARTLVGVTYGYRRFQFPQKGTGDIGTSLVQLFYEHQFSRRLTFGAGAGPEIINLGGSSSGSSQRIDASGFASLQYRLRRTVLKLAYDRLVTKGSGFFAGANRDTVRFSATRPAGRFWELSSDAGYTRARRLEASLAGIPASAYSYGFADAALQRRLGRHINAFISYQFNAETFSGSSCDVFGLCNQVVARHTGLIGVNWHTRAIPLE